MKLNLLLILMIGDATLTATAHKARNITTRDIMLKKPSIKK